MQAQARGSLVGDSTRFTLEAAPRAGGAGITSGGQVNPAGVLRRRFASVKPAGNSADQPPVKYSSGKGCSCDRSCARRTRGRHKQRNVTAAG
jgi:hypothetical protein